MRDTDAAARTAGTQVPHGVLQAMQPRITMQMMLCADEDGDVLSVQLMAHLSQAQLTRQLLLERLVAYRRTAATGPWRRPGLCQHVPASD